MNPLETLQPLSAARARGLNRVARLLPDPAEARRLRAEIRRALSGLQGGEPLPGGGEDALLRVDATGAASDLGDPWGGRLRVRARLRLGTVESHLDLGLEPLRRVAARVLGVALELLVRSDLPTRLEEGVWASLLDQLAAGISGEESLPGAVTLLGFECVNQEPAWGAEGPDAWLGALGVLRLAGQPVAFRLLASARDLEAAEVAGDPPRKLRRLVRRSPHLPCLFHAVGGRVRLRPHEIAGLEVRDILLFDTAGVSEDLGGTLDFVDARGGTAVFRARIEAEGGRVTAEVIDLLAAPAPAPSGAMEDEKMSDVHETAGWEDRVAALPLEVKVEVGRVHLTLAELADLRPGAILSLDRDAAAPVTLTVGEKILGRGELLTVDGQLGVRVLALD